MKNQPKRLRLQKFLSAAGLFSRRKAEEIINSEQIKVNSQIVREKVCLIDPLKDQVYYRDKLVKLPEQEILLAFNKPRRVLCSKRRDQPRRKIIYDFLPVEHQVLRYIGRLDFDSEGLLLLTNNGDLLHSIAHPSKQKSKVYLVWLSSQINLESKEKLLKGVQLNDGLGKFERLDFLGTKKILKVTVTEGRKRFIRRMFKELGYFVERLKRIQIEGVDLKELSLKPGEYKAISSLESKKRCRF